MSAAVCPYCRNAVDLTADGGIECPGCGTPHHLDCYTENGGCTVFGCTAAPAEEPKLRLSGGEVLEGGPAPEGGAAAPIAPPPGLVRTPPPPKPAQQQELNFSMAGFNSGSVLFGPPPPGPVTAPLAVELRADPMEERGKSRTTFILLGVLLGFLGAHNFFAGYRNKALWQLGISLLSLGLAAPMTWVWAVIDVCTIDRDGDGARFLS